MIVAASCMAHAVRAEEPVRIFAAASLSDALSAVVAEFRETRPDVRVTPQYGGSNDLARQIVAGAPADLFFSANREQLDRVAEAGLVEPDARVDLLSNQLVLVRHRDASAPGSFEELRSVERVAMADPHAVPAGVYARRYLQRVGLWMSLSGKIIPTLDVRAALAAVASGNADAGIVYRTDAAMEPRVEVVVDVPRAEGPRIRYALGCVRGRGRPEVVALYDYLTSPRAGAVFRRFGFIELRAE